MCNLIAGSFLGNHWIPVVNAMNNEETFTSYIYTPSYIVVKSMFKKGLHLRIIGWTDPIWDEITCLLVCVYLQCHTILSKCCLFTDRRFYCFSLSLSTCWMFQNLNFPEYIRNAKCYVSFIVTKSNVCHIKHFPITLDSSLILIRIYRSEDEE